MDDRKALLQYARRARGRLALGRGVEWAFRGLLWACVAALAAVLVHKLFGWPLPILPGLAGLGGAVLLTGLLGALLPPIPLGEAAAEIDRRAGWKERLSSALALPAVNHPMEAALVEDVRALLSKRTPSELLPLRAPRELKWVPLAAALLAAAAWLLPTFDLLGVLAEERKKEDEKKEVAVALQKLQEKRKELEKADLHNEAVKKALQKIDEMAKEFEKTPPADPKQALAAVQELSDELKKLKQEMSRSVALAEKIQRELAKEGGELGELGKMLQAGKFDAVAQELAKARAQLGQMTPEQKEKLKKQLEELAKKLDGKDLEDLEKKLADAAKGAGEGDEKKLEDLQEQLNDLGDDLSDAEALADALKDLEDLADSLAKGKGDCPSCGKKGGCPGDGSCPGDLGKGDGKGKGQGGAPWDEGDSEGQGQGSGGKGQGEGGDPPEAPDDVATEKSKSRSLLGKGKYIGAYTMKGDPPKGAAAAEYADVRSSAADFALDALKKQKIPAEQRDYVRAYFDAIRLAEKK